MPEVHKPDFDFVKRPKREFTAFRDMVKLYKENPDQFDPEVQKTIKDMIKAGEKIKISTKNSIMF